MIHWKKFRVLIFFISEQCSEIKKLTQRRRGNRRSWRRSKTYLCLKLYQLSLPPSNYVTQLFSKHTLNNNVKAPRLDTRYIRCTVPKHGSGPRGLRRTRVAALCVRCVPRRARRSTRRLALAPSSSLHSAGRLSGTLILTVSVHQLLPQRQCRFRHNVIVRCLKAPVQKNYLTINCSLFVIWLGSGGPVRLARDQVVAQRPTRW